jgi:hypothetical protein
VLELVDRRVERLLLAAMVADLLDQQVCTRIAKSITVRIPSAPPGGHVE